MTGSDIVALGPRPAPAPQGRKSQDEKPGAAGAAPGGQKAATEAGARDRKDGQAEDFDAALKQEERAGDPARADEKVTAEGRKAAKAGPEAEAEKGQEPAAAGSPLPVAQAQPQAQLQPAIVAAAEPVAATEGEAATAPIAAAPGAGMAGAAVPAVPAVPPMGSAALPAAQSADQAAPGMATAMPEAVSPKGAPVAEKTEAETRSVRGEGEATAMVPRAETARPAPHAAAPAAPPPPPAAAGDARIALPDPAAGGLTLTPTGNVDWRLSAQAAAQAFPREAASHAAATAHSVIGQITLAVGRTEDRRVEIRLDPPELGRVHIHLTPTEQGLQATVVAERPETHALLRRHGEALARDLGDAGYGNVSLDFATGGRETPTEGDRRQAPTASFAAAASAAPMPGAAPSAAPPVTRGGGDGPLDIRL